MALLSGYLAIGTAFTSSTGTLTESAGGGYARPPVTLTYDAASNSFTVSAGEFGPASSAQWTAGVELAIYDSLTGGTMLFAWAQATPAAIVTASFSVPSSTIQLSKPWAVGTPLPNLSVVGTVYNTAVQGVSVYTGAAQVQISAAAAASALPYTAAGIVAKAGGTKALATPLTATINQVATCATLNDSLLLPPAIPGNYPYGLLIANDGAAAATVYGQGTDTVDAVATATGVQLTNATRCIYYISGPGTWVSCKGVKSS